MDSVIGVHCKNDSLSVSEQKFSQILQLDWIQIKTKDFL